MRISVVAIFMMCLMISGCASPLPVITTSLTPMTDLSADTGQNWQAAYLLDDNNGIVIDLNNRLMWMRYLVGTTWDPLSKTAKGSPTIFKNRDNPNVSPLGGKDWREPTPTELYSILTSTAKNSVFAPPFRFPDIKKLQNGAGRLMLDVPSSGSVSDGAAGLQQIENIDKPVLISDNRWRGSYALLVRSLSDEEFLAYDKRIPLTLTTGRISFSDGGLYSGEILGGKPDGKGVRILPGGVVFFGDFQNGVPLAGTRVDLRSDKQPRTVTKDSKSWVPEACFFEKTELNSLMKFIYTEEYGRYEKASVTSAWAGPCSKEGYPQGEGAYVALIRDGSGYKDIFAVLPTTMDHGKTKGDMNILTHFASGRYYGYSDGMTSKGIKNVAQIMQEQENRKKAQAEGWAVMFGAAVKAVDYIRTAASTPNNSVTVVADVVAGMRVCLIRDFTLSNLNERPDMKSPGSIYKNGSRASSINMGLNKSVAGTYRWNADFDCGVKHCSGTVDISGTKKSLNILFYDDCRDAGTKEF